MASNISDFITSMQSMKLLLGYLTENSSSDKMGLFE